MGSCFPSRPIILVIYGAIAQKSPYPQNLFAAGLIPGLLLTGLYVAVALLVAQSPPPRMLRRDRTHHPCARVSAALRGTVAIPHFVSGHDRLASMRGFSAPPKLPRSARSARFCFGLIGRRFAAARTHQFHRAGGRHQLHAVRDRHQGRTSSPISSCRRSFPTLLCGADPRLVASRPARHSARHSWPT